MEIHFTNINKIFFIGVLLFLAYPLNGIAQVKDATITINLHGVYESKISLLSLTGSGIFKPIKEAQGIKNGTTARLQVPKDSLPGEFVLRFDYKEKEASPPYPSEKYIFISEQDLELWVNPKYCNNTDSTYFQKDERENTAFSKFAKENVKQKEKVGVLQNFLMNYDDRESKFYKQGIKEYEQRRQTYNQWQKNQAQQDKALFVSHLYCFQYVPETSWKGTESKQIQNFIDHFFDGTDFKDPLIIKTSDLKRWMDGYINLYGKLSTTLTLRDSLFSVAGRTAIEKAKQGHPLVYGWMVDYFYRGYETNGITAGMKVLEPFLNDPNCLTSKRQEIARRLKGMETLVAGSIAPNISLKDADDKLFELNTLKTQCDFILILFWSAGCSHCMETVIALYPWQQQTAMQQKIKVVAISLDESEEEINAWKQKITELKGWQHMNAPEGAQSKVASDYYVLATPVMVLLDAKTKEIVGIPNIPNELMKVLQ